MSATRELEAAARVLAGRALLARACRTLVPAGIVPVVLKGVLLSALAEGSGAPPRAMADVDVLVGPGERSRAVRALVESGLVVVADTLCATTLRDTELAIDLDLHSALVEPELFRLDAEAIIARSRIDETLFGHSVRVPERKDLYAHLVAHFARGRSSVHDRRRVRDFAILAATLPMDAALVARHLVDLGLARAARHALGLAADDGDALAASVVAALPEDPAGEQLARVASRWLARHGGSSPLALPALHLLNTTVPRGARSFAVHLARGASSRARAMIERATQSR